jgi:hypothetical protein
MKVKEEGPGQRPYTKVSDEGPTREGPPTKAGRRRSMTKAEGLLMKAKEGSLVEDLQRRIHDEGLV